MTQEIPDLRPLLAPASVAVVGGTSKATGLGSRTLAHLSAAGFPGEITTYAGTDEITADVDVAVVAVPAAAAQEVLDRVDGRAKYAVVFSSGFEETGGPALVTRSGTQLLGPNTVGLYHAPHRTTLTFAQAFDRLTDCRHGSGTFLVSQSGAFGARVVSAAATLGFHLDGFIGTGNETRLNACTVARGIVREGSTRVIMLYLEGLRAPEELHALLQEAAAAEVRIVTLLGGLSSAGSTAASSHTSAVSTDTAVTTELLTAHGAQIAHSDREFVLAGLGSSLFGQARGRRAGVVTGSGGAGVVSSDVLSGAGLEVPELSAGLRESIAGKLPAIASTRNPVDVTASAIGDDATVGAVCGALRDSGEVDLLLVIGRVDQGAAAGALTGAVPTVVATLDREPADVRPHIEKGEVVLPDLDSACQVLAAAAPVAPPPKPAGPPPSTRVATLGSDPSAAESLELLSHAGVPIAPWVRATDVDDVVRQATRMGFPVVLKADVEAGVHKARTGGVRLDVGSDTVRAVARDLLTDEDGVLVTTQLRTSLELFVGVRTDPQWGLVVSAGLGGGNVELLDRTVAMPARLGADHLAVRLDEVLFSRIPGRYDGIAARLAAAAEKMVALATDTGAALVECNPFGLVDGELVALDARVIR